jgi:chitinase
VTSFDPEKYPQPRYNFNQWDQWARTTAPNTNVKVFMGVLANWGAGGGYKDPDSLDSVIAHSKKFDRFGGTMIWDASQAWANPEFIGSVKSSMRTLNVRSNLEQAFRA